MHHARIIQLDTATAYAHSTIEAAFGEAVGQAVAIARAACTPPPNIYRLGVRQQRVGYTFYALYADSRNTRIKVWELADGTFYAIAGDVIGEAL